MVCTMQGDREAVVIVVVGAGSRTGVCWGEALGWGCRSVFARAA